VELELVDVVVLEDDGVVVEVVMFPGTPCPAFGYEMPIAPPTTMTTSTIRTKAVLLIARLPFPRSMLPNNATPPALNRLHESSSGTY